MSQDTQGVLLKASDGVSTWTTIPEVRGLNPQWGSRNYEDTSSLDSVEFIDETPVLSTLGTVTFEVNLKTHAMHDQLATDFLAGTVRKYYVYLPLATPVYWSFDASVQTFPLNLAQNSIQRASVTLKITSKPVRATSEPAAA